MGRWSASGRRGNRVFVGASGRAELDFRSLTVATAVTLVRPAAVAVWAVWRFAVSAAAGCLSVCGVVRFGLFACCLSWRWPRWRLRMWGWFVRLVTSRSPRLLRVCLCAGACGSRGPPVDCRRDGGVGDCKGEGGLGGSPFGGRRDDPGFVHVGGCAVWAFWPLAVATAASILLSEAVAVWAVWRLADTAEATCSLLCDGVRFWVARSLTVAAVGALVLAAVAAIGAVRR